MSIDLLSLLTEECPTTDIPNLDNIKNLSANIDEWQYIDPKLHARRLNRILKSEPIRKLYDHTSRAYAAVRRYQCLKDSGFTSLPGQWARTEDPLWLPEDVESCDWRWSAPPGRPPLFWKYVCHSSCHWSVEANIEVAKQLFPDLDWIVVSGNKHSTVLAPEEKLCFDLQYVALQVSLKAGFELLFGNDFDEFDEIIVGTDDSPYLCTEGFAGPALKLFDLIDQDFADRPEEALKHLRDFMELQDDEDMPKSMAEASVIEPQFQLEMMGA